MVRKRNYIILLLQLLWIAVLASGCSSSKNFGEEYNAETDFQYTCMSNMDFVRIIQSGNNGTYIWKNNFIYFLKNDTNKALPLCNKTNCLHDMEEDRIKECNAYAAVDDWGGMKYIAFYENDIYFVENGISDENKRNAALYRVASDGSKKDRIFYREEQEESDIVSIQTWMIHRGFFYYATDKYVPLENEQVRVEVTLERMKLNSYMSEKNAELIYQSSEDITVQTLGHLSAYKDKIYFAILGGDLNKEFDTSENGWIKSMIRQFYCYDLNKQTLIEAEIPEGYSDDTYIQNVAFLDNKLLISLYEYTEDYQYKLPIYIADTDFQNATIWMEEVEQGKFAQTYEDKVFLSDACIQEEANSSLVNVEVYNKDGVLEDAYIYPKQEHGSLKGFGSDGKLIETSDDDSKWYIQCFDLDSVGNYNGAQVELETICEREYGSLNRPEE